MLFNSYIFVLAFLPLCVTGYFFLNHLGKDRMAKMFLLVMSLWFYGYFHVRYLAVILVSMGVNFTAYMLLKPFWKQKIRNLTAAMAILFDVGILFYFKYYGFFAENINTIFQSSLTVKSLMQRSIHRCFGG